MYNLSAHQPHLVYLELIKLMLDLEAIVIKLDGIAICPTCDGHGLVGSGQGTLIPCDKCNNIGEENGLV